MIHWLVQAKRWAQNPPSLKKVILVCCVVVAALVLVSIEYVFGWPAWLTVNDRIPRRF